MELGKKKGFSWIKPRPVHEKNDPQIMQKWRETELPEALKQIQAGLPNKKLMLWAMDEARYGQKGYLVHGWYQTRPKVVKQNKFESAYLTAAAHPTTGKTCSIVTTCMDSKVMSCFFEELSNILAEDEIAVVLLDQAAWHRSKTLELPKNVRLIYFPAYSPELNPIENLWSYLKSNRLANRVYKDINEVIDAGCAALKALTAEEVQSVCHRSYMVISYA
jgi:transposase